MNNQPTINTAGLQGILFNRIKEKLVTETSLVDVISEILHISNDSAYRRIRGETLLVMEEAAELCRHFNLSLDQLMGTKKEDVLFRNVRIRDNQLTYPQYLEGLYQHLSKLSKLKQKEIIYMSKDLPLFHNFYFNPLLAFRYFFWMKVHLRHPDFEKQQFDLSALPADIEEKSKALLKIYCSIPSTEMWNTENINSAIAQIEFSRDSGHFAANADVISVYEALEQSINHMKLQAAYGTKFMPGEEPEGKEVNYRFFFNRVVLGDNTIIIVADTMKSVLINYGNLNYIETTDENFCNELYKDFENLIKRSTQISISSERQRNNFFNILLAKIEDRKRNLLT